MRKVCEYVLLRNLLAHEGLELFIKPGPLVLFLEPSPLSWGATLQSGKEEPVAVAGDLLNQDAGVPGGTVTAHDAI